MSSARSHALKQAKHELKSPATVNAERHWAKLRGAVRVAGAFKAAGRERLLKDEDRTPTNEIECKPGDIHVTIGRCKEAYINSAMMLAVPAGLAAYWLEWPPWTVFWLNFMAIIPLSSFLGQATEDLSSYTSEVIAGLLNATFGNVVEMMVAFLALVHDELGVVQSALLGSMLSNLLFVLGSCLLYGGCRTHELRFSSKAAQTCTSLLLLGSLTLVIPTFLAYQYPEHHTDGIPDADFLNISRYSSVVIFLSYGQFLWFQLKTHADYFSDDTEDDEDDARWSAPFAVLVLAIMSVLTAMCSDGLVASIDEYSKSWNISKAFIGLILVASVGNIPEFYVTLMVARSNKLDLALTIAVGSSCQMALFVTPFAVLCGWCMDKPMSLNFHGLQIICLILTVLVVSSVIQGGTATWLQGSLLVSFYVVIAMSFFFLPADV